jgi:hypothetical protein
VRENQRIDENLYNHTDKTYSPRDTFELRPAILIEMQELRDERLQLLTDLLAQRFEFRLRDLEDQIADILSIKGASQRDQLIQHTSQRPHITLLIVSPAFTDLRREITRRADEGGGLTARAQLLADAEVAEFADGATMIE